MKAVISHLLLPSLSFSPSRRRVCVSININYDYIYEGSENFIVRLTGQNLPSYVRLTPSSTTVQIRNVDSELVAIINLVPELCISS